MSKIDLQPLLVRELVIKAIRAFFDERDFREVIVPVLNSSLPLEPTLYSFHTEWSKLDKTQQLYLSVSPEAALKKMLAQGIGNCYAIGKCFRNLENAGSRHNPEFLMLEWYRQGADYQQIMTDTEELVSFVQQFVQKKIEMDVPHVKKKWPVVSLAALFTQYIGLDLEDLQTEAALKKIAAVRGYQTEDATWEQLFDQLFLNEIEPHFTKESFFLTDFPARLSPLCAIQADRPWLAERFEVYMQGMEIGNGNSEELNAELVEKKFAAEQTFRTQTGLPSHPIDQDFLAALRQMKKSGHRFAGIGLGVDRLAMIMAGVSDIKQVEPFAVRKN